MIYRKRRFAPAQTPDQSRRQSDLVQSAWRHFGEAARMIAFLNTHHKKLDAVPLSLAIESDDGLERVQRLLCDVDDSLRPASMTLSRSRHGQT